VVLVLVIPYVGAIIYLLRRESSRVEHHDDAPVRSTPRRRSTPFSGRQPSTMPAS